MEDVAWAKQQGALIKGYSKCITPEKLVKWNFTLHAMCLNSQEKPLWMFTLCLHSRPHQRKGVTGQLSTGAGSCPASQEHKHPGIHAVCGVILQPGILQCLKKIKGERGYYQALERKTKNQFNITHLKQQINKMGVGFSTNLVHCQVDASVWNDPQYVGNVSLVERPEALLLENPLCTVCDSRVLPGLPQSQSGFQHLRNNNEATHCQTALPVNFKSYSLEEGGSDYFKSHGYSWILSFYKAQQWRKSAAVKYKVSQGLARLKKAFPSNFS